MITDCSAILEGFEKEIEAALEDATQEYQRLEDQFYNTAKTNIIKQALGNVILELDTDQRLVRFQSTMTPATSKTKYIFSGRFDIGTELQLGSLNLVTNSKTGVVRNHYKIAKNTRKWFFDTNHENILYCASLLAEEHKQQLKEVSSVAQEHNRLCQRKTIFSQHICALQKQQKALQTTLGALEENLPHQVEQLLAK